MSDKINHDRRRFFGAAAMTIAVTQFGFTGTAEAQLSKARPAGLRPVKPGAPRRGAESARGRLVYVVFGARRGCNEIFRNVW